MGSPIKKPLVALNDKVSFAQGGTPDYLDNYHFNLRKNLLINGNFDVWQRGTSFSNIADSYTADRWMCFRASGTTGKSVSRQTLSAGDVDRSRYSARVQRDSGNSSTNILYFAQALETADSFCIRNKYITVSFYGKCGANYSPASSYLYVQANTGEGTDQTTNGGWTNQDDSINSPVVLTTSWQKFTVTSAAVVPNDKTQIRLLFYANVSGTAGTNDWFEITQVQVETGNVATEFDFRHYHAEFSLCKRYYREYGNSAGNDYILCPMITAQANRYILPSFSEPMRIKPVCTVHRYDNGTIDRVIEFSTASEFTVSSANVGGTWGSGYLQTSTNGTYCMQAYLKYTAEL